MKSIFIPERQVTEQSKKTRDRYRLSDSQWVASFSCSHLKILIVCRGPIRKEAMDVFSDMGASWGILLSEKDSVTYPYTLAPELRVIKDQSRIHRVPDYAGSSAEEKRERIAQIIDIAKRNNYTHIFAGYGFMAEDAGFVEAIEGAGIGFIGPASGVHHAAGAKDHAKVMARKLGVSVTPGIDNITALTLLKKVGGTLDGLKKLVREYSLDLETEESDPVLLAEHTVTAGYEAGRGLFTLAELQAETRHQMEQLFRENPGKRFRFKHVGGGGGKGQRIISSVAEVNDAIVQVLSESKAMGEADNKNFLIELNVEETRHNEIQLLGNGKWCIALGGRDCSLQMHEQKLLELSLTDELYIHEIEQAKKNNHNSQAETLEKDRQLLRRMEEQAETFGVAVGLNSVSTFECIVSGDDFYFMEMNTRIQVEHRVTEMSYTLRFENPYNDSDFFVVESLVEVMVLLAVHGSRLPVPIRVPNNRSGGEVRLNATNDVLAPHAGGIIEYWSPPVDHEIRDDQGISILNPDTGWFMNYHLAGAYDSNIALVVTYGSGRREKLERLGDILRQMEIRGQDLQTNLNFHYGLINFCLGLHPMMKPDTRFVVPYLAAVGSLAKEMSHLDLDWAWNEMRQKVSERFGSEAVDVFLPKLTFLTRPLKALLAEPHAAMGWLVYNNGKSFILDKDRVVWKRNPVRVLEDLYHYLRLEDRPGAPPSQKIWDHDLALLKGGLEFYDDLEKLLGIDSEKEYESYVKSLQRFEEESLFEKLDRSLRSGRNLFRKGEAGIQSDAMDDALFEECGATHRGWQLGLDLINLIVLMGKRSGIFDFSVDERLRPIVPEQFTGKEKQKEFLYHLAPPPKASSNEIVAVSGGMFYSRETPQSAPYLEEGQHFEVGDPIYIIEVMKMFNKVYAEFAGTVQKSLVSGDAGVIVKKGQPLYIVKPDVEMRQETEEEAQERRQEYTKELLASFL